MKIRDDELDLVPEGYAKMSDGVYRWGVEDELLHLGQKFSECWSTGDLLLLADRLIKVYKRVKEEEQAWKEYLEHPEVSTQPSPADSTDDSSHPHSVL